MRTLSEIERAHEILHPIAKGEIGLNLSIASLNSLIKAHDALAYALNLPCDNGFGENLEEFERIINLPAYDALHIIKKLRRIQE